MYKRQNGKKLIREVGGVEGVTLLIIFHFFTSFFFFFFTRRLCNVHHIRSTSCDASSEASTWTLHIRDFRGHISN